MTSHSQSELPAGHYRVHVSYKLKPIVELRKQFDGVSDAYDGRPWERHSSCMDIDTTDGERVMFLKLIPEEFLGKRVDSIRNKLAETIDLLGYRFAVEVEAIAFGLAHPEIHRRERINAYGSSASCDDSRHVNACLYEFEGDRELGIRYYDCSPHKLTFLLLVRK
jgi:hypothetical protein